MAKTDHASVDDYIAAQREELRPVLEQVRAAIRKGVPDAVEVISYQMPAYKAAGGVVIFFAVWKDHFALYPFADDATAPFEKELAPYARSKGGIRFPLSQKPPLKLIEKLARARAAETQKRFEEKKAARAAGRRGKAKA
jgi:uncharacterized protein YdhG (YjbR/CyaY superfamily)